MQRHEVIAGSSFLRLAFIDVSPNDVVWIPFASTQSTGSVPQNRCAPNRDTRIQFVFQSAFFDSIDFVLSRCPASGVDALEQLQRHRTRQQHRIVESTDVIFGAEQFLCSGALRHVVRAM